MHPVWLLAICCIAFVSSTLLCSVWIQYSAVGWPLERRGVEDAHSKTSRASAKVFYSTLPILPGNLDLIDFRPRSKLQLVSLAEAFEKKKKNYTSLIIYFNFDPDDERIIAYVCVDSCCRQPCRACRTERQGTCSVGGTRGAWRTDR